MGWWPFKHRRGGAVDIAEDTLCARSFAAAEVSRILSPWKWDGGFSNTEVAASLDAVRSRSRDMAKNSEYFARWLQLWVANIVGPDGFRLKSFAEKSDADVAVDADAAYFIETHWAKWAASRDYADTEGQMGLNGILRLAVEGWARDGEAFVLIERNAQNPYGISLRVLRPECCDVTYTATVSDAVGIRNGIEFDRRTYRRLAYWFKADNADTGSDFMDGAKRIRVPASDVVHLYTPRDAFQLRGFPLSHPFLRKLKMLDEFDVAELVAARDEANTLGVFHAPAGREAEIRNLAKDGSTRDRIEAKSEPGSKIVLPQGWDYDPKNPTHPNAGLPSFKASMLRDVASGAGVEYANFANDWSGVSYSSVRVGTLAERDQWLTRQAEVIDRMLDPIFAAWLGSFLALRVSGIYGVGDYRRLLSHAFRGRRWQWVDPLKDVNAAVVAVEHGWKTDAEIASDYGGDIDDNIAEAARIRPAKEAAGLATGADAAAGNGQEAEDGEK